jgi:hypothetical protein
MPKKYKITHNSLLTGGPDKSDLIGCQIRENDAGTQYELLFVVSRTTGTTLPTPPFNFPSFDFADTTWTFGVSTMPASNAPATGTWNTADNPTAQDGTWQAQSDQGNDDDLTAEDDAAAASA